MVTAGTLHIKVATTASGRRVERTITSLDHEQHSGGRDTSSEYAADEAAHFWAAGDFVRFARAFEERDRQRICRSLLQRFTISREDVEDAVGDGLNQLLDRYQDNPSIVSNPVAYIYKCAYFCALQSVKYWRARNMDVASADDATISEGDIAEERRVEYLVSAAHEDSALEQERTDLEGIADEQLVDLVEEAMPDVEVGADWARDMVAAAMAHLTATESKIVEFFLSRSGTFDHSKNDYEITSEAASGDLGMSADAFRKAKSRAFKKLRTKIPDVVTEMGIRPPARFEEAVFPDKWSGPDEE